jgi:D-hydroxyproline dehydrogenase subunit beta
VRPVQTRRCVVIGAGVLGASIAARLAAAGLSVTLLDQDEPGRGTSRWSFAWVNSNDKRPRPYHDLNHAGLRAWAELAPSLDGAAWYRPVGHVELAADGSELAARVGRLASWGYPARLLDPAEAAELEPALLSQPGQATAAWFSDEAYLLTEPLIARLVAYLARQGGTVQTGEHGRVTDLDAGPGDTSRIRTAAGAVIDASQVVCCAGRWTPALAALAGAPGTVPLVAWDTPGSIAPALVVRVGPITREGPARVIHTPQIALRPHPGGLLHLEAPDLPVDLHTPEAELRRLAGELLERAQRTVRGLAEARVVAYQVCARPLPADEQSIVGRLPGAGWLYVAVTHSGVTLAAHLSRLIAAELATGASSAELAPYRPDRFVGPAMLLLTLLPGGDRPWATGSGCPARFTTGWLT